MDQQKLHNRLHHSLDTACDESLTEEVSCTKVVFAALARRQLFCYEMQANCDRACRCKATVACCIHEWHDLGLLILSFRALLPNKPTNTRTHGLL